jgi:hypothetical protein
MMGATLWVCFLSSKPVSRAVPVTVLALDAHPALASMVAVIVRLF